MLCHTWLNSELFSSLFCVHVIWKERWCLNQAERLNFATASKDYTVDCYGKVILLHSCRLRKKTLITCRCKKLYWYISEEIKTSKGISHYFIRTDRFIGMAMMGSQRIFLASASCTLQMNVQVPSWATFLKLALLLSRLFCTSLGM